MNTLDVFPVSLYLFIFFWTSHVYLFWLIGSTSCCSKVFFAPQTNANLISLCVSTAPSTRKAVIWHFPEISRYWNIFATEVGLVVPSCVWAMPLGRPSDLKHKLRIFPGISEMGWMDGWCLVRWCFEKMVVEDVLGCSCQKRGRMKKAGTRTCRTFFWRKKSGERWRCQHPSSSTGRTYWTMDVPRMIQRCNAFVLSQPGVIKKGNCFFFETLWLSFGEVIALSCVDVYWSIGKGTIYDCECFVTEWRCPESYMFLSSKCLKEREMRIWVASTLGI